MIRLVLLILIILAVAGFGLENAEQTITLHYFFGYSTPPLPVYQVVLGTAFGSGLLVILLLFPEWVRLRLLVRRQKKALKQTETALHRVNPPDRDEEGGAA
jgi:lipopolysaccharide assembly protein A